MLDPDDKAKRCDLLLTLGEALGPAGEPQRVYEGVAREALVLAEALGDGGKAAHACQLALMALFRYGGLPMQGSADCQSWAEIADRYAHPQTLDRVYADLAMAQIRSARFFRAGLALPTSAVAR